VTTVLAPPLRWVGGKRYLMPKILPLLPDHRTSVELFGGGAVFTFSKRRAPVEILNDIDPDLMGFYRVLQNPDQFDRLLRLVSLTPYSRQVWSDCRQMWQTCDDPVDRAYRWFIMARQGWGGKLDSWGSSNFTTRSGVAKEVHSWLTVIDRLPALHERLVGVHCINFDWSDLVGVYDAPDTLFYADPPYVFDTRKGGGYRFELTDDQHRTFIDRIQAMKGMIIVSGYDHPIYTPLTDAGWIKHEFKITCSLAGRTKRSGLQGVGNVSEKQQRIECLWVSPNCGIRQSSFADLLVDDLVDDLV
jgi:DNA adenine methylase